MLKAVGLERAYCGIEKTGLKIDEISCCAIYTKTPFRLLYPEGQKYTTPPFASENVKTKFLYIDGARIGFFCNTFDFHCPFSYKSFQKR